MKKFATASGATPVLHRNTANLMQTMLDEVKSSITILPELQALIPPLQHNEFAQLESNIRRDGCREALLIWQTTQGAIDGSADNSPVNILIDGHNRYTICTKYNLDFKVILREFSSLLAVRDFMIDNQLGRRNLTHEQMSYLRGLKYRNERQVAGRPVQDELSLSPEDSAVKSPERTQDRLAREFNVSPRTIHRDREYSEGIDKLVPELKTDVLNGKQKISKELIRAVGRTAQIESSSPLSLPELLAFNEPDSTIPISSPASSNVVRLVKEIAQAVSALNPASASFDETCDRIIRMVNEAKMLKKK
jgi:hypothetical protein